MAAADETKPFEEKYQAREILGKLRQCEYLGDKYTANDNCSVLRVALGLVTHR